MDKYTWAEAPEVPDQLGLLEALLDPITIRRTAELTLPSDAHCWEIGAGAGSIARHLATTVCPDGRVLATDLDTSHLDPTGIEVLRHDIRTDPPPTGSFHLIHARLLLLHLPARTEVLTTLVDALRPGGHLLIEDWHCAPPQVAIQPPNWDHQLYRRTMEALMTELRSNGTDLTWATRLPTELTAAGLTQVDGIVHTETWPGGSPGCLLNGLVTRQLADKLVPRGITSTELARFREMLLDPALLCWSYPLHSVRGTRPA